MIKFFFFQWILFGHLKNENKTYWQLKAVQTKVTEGIEITDHKQKA